jgi:hypothetical protein
VAITVTLSGGGAVPQPFLFGEVQPGNSYKVENGAPLILNVTSDTATTGREAFGQAVGSFVAHEWLWLSLDDATYVNGPVLLGDFTAGQSKALYVDVRVPEAAPGTTPADFSLVVGTQSPLITDASLTMRVEQGRFDAFVDVQIFDAFVDVQVLGVAVSVDFIIGDSWPGVVDITIPDLRLTGWVDVPVGNEPLGTAFVDVPYVVR